MSRFARDAVLAAGLLAVSAVAARAQRDRYAPIVLQLPASARATGLGGATVALRDIESLFANPALAGTLTGVAVSGEQFRASRQGTIAASVSLGTLGVSVGAQFFDFGVSQGAADGFPTARQWPAPSTVIDERAAAAASSFSGAIALAAAFKGYRFGLAAKYIDERLGVRRAERPAFDLGIARDRGRVTVGLSVQNIGPTVDFAPLRSAQLPLRATLGMAAFGLTEGPLDLGLSAAVTVRRDGYVAPAVGMEWSYWPLEGYTFAVRAGVRRPELREQRPLTAGASFTLDRISVDYAFEQMRHGAGHRIGLRLR